MNFVAVDVETANCDKASICQVGWSVVADGKITETSSVLIDPQVEFDPFNIGIHGITAADVRGSPTFADVRERLRAMMNTRPVVSNGLFDRAAFDLADDGDPGTWFVRDVPWVNAQRIVRRAWPEHFARKYKLSHVAETLGLDLVHHDAESDARVLAEAVLMAANVLDMAFDELVQRAHQPLSSPDLGARRVSRTKASIRRDGSGEGVFLSQVFCFTGTLPVAREKLADLVSSMGAEVSSGVSSKTTVLVVGCQMSSLVAGNKSSKHRKAETLVAKGQNIEILTAEQFLEVLSRHGVTLQLM